MRRKVIIDTDCGGDDAVALIAAFTHPDVEVVAVTCCWGNVEVDQAVENAGKLIDFFGRNTPLYRGAAEPILGHRETVQWAGYGSDGFGDAQFPRSVHAASVPKKHAALALAEILGAVDGSGEEADVAWQLVVLGPLTNIALALKLEPNLLKNLGHRNGVPGVVVMGGTTEAKGNSGMSSEFNFHCDPEAARIVFMARTVRTPLYLVSWELTVNCAMTWDFFDKWLNRQVLPDGSRHGVDQNRVQVLLEKLFGRLEVFTRPADDGRGPETGDHEVTQDVTCVIPDAVAMVAALYNNFITDSIETFATIELHGQETRGATVIDWYGTDASMAKKGRWRNCRVITKVSLEIFLQAMRRLVHYGATPQS